MCAHTSDLLQIIGLCDCGAWHELVTQVAAAVPKWDFFPREPQSCFLRLLTDWLRPTQITQDYLP